ncbi:phage tail protein [Campylobacter sputorum]|uniref:phage tail protein n=1 Tax=Campylobacter sputorum TaxID=206 RepID=UPI00053BDA70|nr:phage tail protein [Campylobacter sputorum]
MANGTILTKQGLNLTLKATSGEKIKLVKMKISDDDSTISEDDISMNGNIHEFDIASITIDERDPNMLVISSIIPAGVGGFWIKKVGVFDEFDKLFAISNFAPSYKPLLDEGIAKSIIINFYLTLSNAQCVELRVDDNLIYAPRQWVIDNHYNKAYIDALMLKNKAEFKKDIDDINKIIQPQKDIHYGNSVTFSYSTELQNALKPSYKDGIFLTHEFFVNSDTQNSVTMAYLVKPGTYITKELFSHADFFIGENFTNFISYEEPILKVENISKYIFSWDITYLKINNGIDIKSLNLPSLKNLVISESKTPLSSSPVYKTDTSKIKNLESFSFFDTKVKIDYTHHNDNLKKLDINSTSTFNKLSLKNVDLGDSIINAVNDIEIDFDNSYIKHFHAPDLLKYEKLILRNYTENDSDTINFFIKEQTNVQKDMILENINVPLALKTIFNKSAIPVIYKKIDLKNITLQNSSLMIKNDGSSGNLSICDLSIENVRNLITLKEYTNFASEAFRQVKIANNPDLVSVDRLSSQGAVAHIGAIEKEKFIIWHIEKNPKLVSMAGGYTSHISTHKSVISIVDCPLFDGEKIYMLDFFEYKIKNSCKNSTALNLAIGKFIANTTLTTNYLENLDTIETIKIHVAHYTNYTPSLIIKNLPKLKNIKYVNHSTKEDTSESINCAKIFTLLFENTPLLEEINLPTKESSMTVDQEVLDLSTCKNLKIINFGNAKNLFKKIILSKEVEGKINLNGITSEITYKE